MADEAVVAAERTLASRPLPVEFTKEDEDRKLLRGVPVHEVLSGFGRRWDKNSLRSEAGKSWAYSVPVRRLGAFLSHSWSDSRWLKLLCMLAFYTARLAAVGGTLASFFTAGLGYFGYVTQLEFIEEYPIAGVPYRSRIPYLPAIAGWLVGASLFFAGQHVWRVVATVGCITPSSAFLDKLVIHQDDEELRDRGIKLLGAFLGKSDAFVVLLSSRYLSRLWCVYELGVFEHLRLSYGHAGTVEVWPLPQAFLVLAWYAVQITWSALVPVVDSVIMPFVFGANSSAALSLVTSQIILLPATLMLVSAMVTSATMVDDLQKQITEFSFDNAQCFLPEDRVLVESSLVAWFDPEQERRDFAIDSFNRFVREEMSSSFVGFRGALSWRVALWTALPTIWADAVGALVNSQLPAQAFWLSAFYTIVFDLAKAMLALQLVFAAVASLERCRLHKFADEEPLLTGTEPCTCRMFAVRALQVASSMTIICAVVCVCEITWALPPLPLVLSNLVILGITALSFL